MEAHYKGLIILLVLCIPSKYYAEKRTIYLQSDDSHLQAYCPVDHCFSLIDVTYNQSYFFDSNTTLELLPGKYDITSTVGQLVIANISNFILKGTSNTDTVIGCQPNTTLGFVFQECYNITVSNIQIYSCHADLWAGDGFSSKILTTYKAYLDIYLRFNLGACDSGKDSHAALCYNSIMIIDSTRILLHKVSIFHSKGVGILGIGNSDFHISKSQMEFNKINCVNFIVNVYRKFKQTKIITMSLSELDITLGHITSLPLASGLNIFLHLTTAKFVINLTNVTLFNNTAPYGNLVVQIYTMFGSTIMDSLEFSNLVTSDVHILIKNLSSIQTVIDMQGIVVRYLLLEPCQWNHSLVDERILTAKRTCQIMNIGLRYIYDTPTAITVDSMVNISIQNSSFIGSCVVVQDSEGLTEDGIFFFEMNRISIIESMCSMALSVIAAGRGTTTFLQLRYLTITDSLNDTIFVDIGTKRIEFVGNTSFIKNQGSFLVVSGKISFKRDHNYHVTFQDHVQFCGNMAHKYESVFLISDSSEVSFQSHITVIFVNNSGKHGGAISAYNSHLYFRECFVNFIGNSGDNGGAISLSAGSVIHLDENPILTFKANKAKYYGGAIYVEDHAGLLVDNNGFINCFIQVSGRELYLIVDDMKYEPLNFENNTAGTAGTILFGGWIDICKLKNNKHIFDYFKFSTDNCTNCFSSKPFQVCVCTNSIPNTTVNETYVEAIPGQTIEVQFVTIGQRFEVIPATIRAETHPSDVIDQLQTLQTTSHKCTTLKYTVHYSNKQETITLLLKVDRQDLPEQIPVDVLHPKHYWFQFGLFIHLKDCPLGFEFNNNQAICSCNHLLQKQCNLTSYTINRYAQQWISLGTSKNIIIHEHCPYDYCKPHDLSLNLSNPDSQCAFNRMGILCGSCRPGLSQVLGTSNCKKCSNLWLLLIFIFAIAGVLLVAGFIKLNITISTGTISGLIFYANIVRANTAVFFPDRTANTFLSWFIAWLNLDVGIETCFYNGLDAYMKTWLQYIFPLYIWFLVIVIIISSKYSKRAANTFGVNAVQVLATLFLLSYAKLLRLTITVFQPTHLLEGYYAWHYDGNIAYLGKWHALLMLAALLLFVLFLLPYTLILFSIQWLQIFSHYKPFCWVNKLKPLFDAYTGPYKDKHRYWTGLLLLIRIGLFIVFSANTSGDPAVNLLAIIVIVACLFAYLAMFGGIYKNWLLNLLEYSSLLNLTILSTAVLYYIVSGNKQNHTSSQASVSITLCTTILIVAYHGIVVALKALKLDTRTMAFWKCNKIDRQPLETADETQQHDMILNPPVTCTIVELKEPLLEC